MKDIFNDNFKTTLVFIILIGIVLILVGINYNTYVKNNEIMSNVSKPVPSPGVDGNSNDTNINPTSTIKPSVSPSNKPSASSKPVSNTKTSQSPSTRPTPSPSTKPSPSPSAKPSPSPSPSPSAKPSPSPSPSPIPVPSPLPSPSIKPSPIPSIKPSPSPDIKVNDTSFKGFTLKQIKPVDKKVTYTEFQMSTKKQVERGITGNNSQWITQFESSSNGDLMLFSEDVSGMFKSTDHGLTWKRANSGITSPGVGMFGIDPHNSNHVLALGLSSREYIGSIFISNDGANSWKKSCFYESDDKKCNGTSSNGARYQYDGLEFDPTSYDSGKKQSMIVYYSTPFIRDNELTHNKTGDGKDPIDQEKFSESEAKYYKLMRLNDIKSQEEKKNKMGLYISRDGGNTFEMFIKDVKLSDGMVKVLNNGSLYVGNEYGLFKIDKKNKKISKSYLINDTDMTSHGITGLDSVGNTIYAQTWDGIYRLEDGSDDLIKLTDSNYPNVWPRSLEVSQTNPNHILITYRKSVTNYYSNTLTYSLDGGKTWTDSEIDLDTTYYTANSWKSREKMIVVDPTNDKNVLTTGGDYIAHSEDYGAHFIQSSGATHTMQGGKFNFNYYQPELLFLSAQDYTGNITHDGAKSFSDVVIKDSQNNNLGNVYGGFAADDDTWYGFVKQTWCGGNLMVTHNGGDTWEDTGLTSIVHKCSFYSSLQSINNPNVLFANEYYSKDRGYTWKKMNGATSVFTYNFTGKHELYGADSDGDIVVSYDDGDTWKKVSTVTWTEDSMYDKTTGKAKYGENIIDMAYDHVNNIFYVIGMTFTNEEHSGDRTYLYKYDVSTGVKERLNVPRSNGTMRFKTVAVDPNSTSVIYVGGSGDYFSAVDALSRSIDGGKTWRVLTTHNDSSIEAWANNQGGYEISNLRVDPYTGYVLMSAGCNGYFLIDPPYDASLLKHSKPLEHTIKYVYNNKIIDTRVQKNNTKHLYKTSIDGYVFKGWYLDKELTKQFVDGSYVYSSMVLYAKMEKSNDVTFYDGDKIIKVLDADKYSESMDELVPERDGYVFAGWYTDKSLKAKVDFSKIDTNTEVYAGYYKVIDNIYDVNCSDVDSAINYTDHKTSSLGNFYDNSKKINNRSSIISIKENTNYFITLKMDNRFRLGFFETNYPSGYKEVPNVFIHSYDTNSKSKHVNKNVSYLLKNKSYKKMMIYYYYYYYYSLNDDVKFMDVKNTIRVYELEDLKLYL